MPEGSGSGREADSRDLETSGTLLRHSVEGGRGAEATAIWVV